MEEVKNVESLEEKQETKEEVKNKDIFKYELKKPITEDGKEIKELTFDFGALTGNDALAIEEEMESRSQYALAPETSRTYQIHMAARAAGVSFELLQRLSFQDFNRIANAARNFLVGQAL